MKCAVLTHISIKIQC